MKQKIRLGDCYALTKHKLKHQYIPYISLLAVLTSMCLYAVKQVSAQQAEPAATAVADIIGPDAKSQYSILGVHEVGNKVYLQIPDSILGRDILAVKRLAKGWAGKHPYVFWRGGPVGYAGDHIDELVFRIQNCGNKICFVKPDFTERASEGKANMERVFKASAVYPVIASLAVISRNPQGTASIVDMTAILESDHELFGFSKTSKSEFGLGGYNATISGPVIALATDSGLQVKSTKAYSMQNQSYSVLLELVTNWLVLPKEPLRQRPSDYRIGYYTVDYRDLGTNPFETTNKKIITRWRLEPKPGDLQRYLLGELVEPQQPIVFYVDPAIPRQWIPYMIEGINDWQEAFEQAGFKNAIRGKVAPEGDNSSPDLYGMGHGYISYKPDLIPSAVTITNVDPRSGEIVGASISWWHGMVRQLIGWYRLQAGTSDRRAWTGQLDEAVMGRLVRYIVSHEVGHALGLKHNFGAASATPVERLRDRDWLKNHSFSPSVMDYARTNHIAQPEDSVGLEGMVPRIGVYDKWAIEWAYRYRPPTADAEIETLQLSKWAELKQEDPNLWYGDEDHQNTDPSCLREDIGDDPVLSAHYGILNLKRLLDSLPAWVGNPGVASNHYKQLVRQYQTHIGNVAAFIGGRHHRPRGRVEAWPQNVPVSDSLQEDALAFLDEQFFQTPVWLLENSIVSEMGIDALAMLTKYQEESIPPLVKRLLNGNETTRLTMLQRYVFGSLVAGKETDEYRRALQRTYMKALIALSGPDAIVPDEQEQAARELLDQLRTHINQLAPHGHDARSTTHLRTLQAVLEANR